LETNYLGTSLGEGPWKGLERFGNLFQKARLFST